MSDSNLQIAEMISAELVQNDIAKVGATTGSDPLAEYKRMLQWMKDTSEKLPDGSSYTVTPQMREDSFDVDPLLSGQIIPYKMNTLLAGGNLKTSDNRKYSAAIKQIEDFHTNLGTLEALREGFEDYASKHGKMFLRCEPSFNKLNVPDARLSYLDNKTMKVYTDPFNSKEVVYHQKINILTEWNEAAPLKEVNSWWIPSLESGETWSEEENNDKNSPVYQAFQVYVIKYKITDVKNLRIGSCKDLIVLKKKKAPIDRCMLAIWLKRLMLVQSPNIIYRVLAPIIHMTAGKPIELTIKGETVKVPTAPPKPNENLKNTSPEIYLQQLKDYNAHLLAVKTAADRLIQCTKEGGVFVSNLDIGLDVVESGRTVPASFIKQMIDINDEEIGQAHGFPVVLVKASGSELATSRSVKETLAMSSVGEKTSFEGVYNQINKEFFGKSSWQYEIEEDNGTVTTGLYRYGDIEAKWNVILPDTRDQLIESQTFKNNMDAMNIVKSIGASKADSQALLDEKLGLGILDLDNYNSAQPEPFMEVTTSPTSTKEDDLDINDGTETKKKEGVDPITSATLDSEQLVKELEPSGATTQDIPIITRLFKAYKAASGKLEKKAHDHEHDN